MTSSPATAPPADLARPRRRVDSAVWLLSAGHAVDDLYQGAVPALIPFFVAARHWDYAAASGITVAATVLSSVVQPLFGLLTDRRRAPWLVPLGMTVAGAGIGLSGLSHYYWLTWLAVALSGIGVAAYHPESARLARVAARGSHVGMSLFSMGGNVGFALGPVIVGIVLGALGTTGTLPLLGPALACGLITMLALRHTPWAHEQRSATGAGATPPASDWRGFTKLTVVIVGRSVVTFGLGTFLALLVEQRLHTGTTVGEAALITFYGVGALGTLLGGRLASRWSRVGVVRVAYALAIPSLAAIWLLPGPAMFAGIAATALTLYIPFSLQVTLGQDYLPGRVGTASGVTLGLAVSLGGVASPLIALVADHTTLRTAVATLTVIPIACALITLRLREPAPASAS
jgi:MFS transporter, FSR family, fosmidomycin resistance protein